VKYWRCLYLAFFWSNHPIAPKEFVFIYIFWYNLSCLHDLHFLVMVMFFFFILLFNSHNTILNTYIYSYLDLNNCWQTMIIEVTFELITCDWHSQEMNFMPYLFVLFYLMSSHREIRLNRTLLRHVNIFF
jgi:hypothetical protein